jgi:hypothetical protein
MKSFVAFHRAATTTGAGVVIPVKAGIHFAVAVRASHQGQNGSRLAPG